MKFIKYWLRFSGMITILAALVIMLTVPTGSHAKKKKITLENVKTIAVLPFAFTIPSRSIISDAGEFVMVHVVEGMTKKCKFTLIDPALILSAMGKQKIKLGPQWDPKAAIDLGKAVGADAVLLGCVIDIDEDADQNDDGLGNIINVNELDIEITIRLIRVETGEELGTLQLDEYRRDTRRAPMTPISHPVLWERCCQAFGKKLRKQVISN